MPDRARLGGLNKLISSEFHHVYSDICECEVPLRLMRRILWGSQWFYQSRRDIGEILYGPH